MGLIRRTSATVAGLYCTFVTLLVVCIFNFSVTNNTLPINVAYGAVLIVLSILSIIVGISAEHPEESVLRSFQLCLAAMWGSIGIYHVTEGTNPQGVTDSQALWAGYGAFLLIFLLFVIGALQHKAKFAAVLSLGFFLSCIFEIASLWRPLRSSAGSYYILLAALTLYSIASNLITKLKKRDDKDNVEPQNHAQGHSKDYIPLGHAMDTLAFAIFAGHVTGIYNNPRQEFMWVVSAGIFQSVAGVVAVRRSDAYNGCLFFLHGMFWMANAYTLTVEYATGTPMPPLIAVQVIYIITFFCVSIISLTREIYQFLQHLSLCIMCIAFCVNGFSGVFLGAMGWISFIFSLYGLAAHISRLQNGSFKIPLGVRCVETAKLKNFLVNKCRCCAVCIYGRLKESGGRRSSSLFSSSEMLGFSKYLDLDSVGFALNAVSALAVVWAPLGPAVMPWVIGFGGIPQMVVASIAFARGLTVESCAFFTFSCLWLIWGPARGLGILVLDNSVAAATGCIAFLCVGLLNMGLAALINKAWFVVCAVFELVVLAFLLRVLAVPAVSVYEIVIIIIFVIVCVYCFAASALKTVWGREVLPMGKPLLQVSYIHSQGDRAIWADAKKQSGVNTIGEIMNKGGICGIPTDVVYVLVAAVKFPKSVERAYKSKKEAEDRPMSMWISRRDQIAAGRPLFGELLWDFMEEIWPGTVSLVLPKGPWLDSLGIGYAEKYIGRPDSIATRMPDNTVTSALLDICGPVASTSANPTGEADTTHHLQVLAKLGLENCDGILCSGPAPENSASTVVDCRNINKGQLGFFRIGIVKRTFVESVFEGVLNSHRGKKMGLPASPSTASLGSRDSGMGGGDGNNTDSPNKHADSDSGGGHDNPAFEDDTVSIPLDDVTTEAQVYEEQIGGRTNPSYDEEEFSTVTGSETYSRDNPYDEAAPAAPGRASLNVDFGSERSTDQNPYEPIARFSGVPALLKASRQIGGKKSHSFGGADAHIRLNPVYKDK
ncbi:uncharacterized protein LOC124112776 [Haliotis rufescens]|uniref:uncharacterized protein LOC124112776 n=1 Tax=Haliotis rufescens TaxID=6454 RepID=UPI001EB084B1|nr:uncharacterized protein LOC124112776 [Haliotis rufescens]